MFKKIAIITAALFVLLTSAPANAAVDASSNIPEFNSFCWHRSDCRAVRKQFFIGSVSEAELDKGFITDASVAPCRGGTGDAEWGRCLPAGQTKTEISFGGKSEFSNIGEFIVLMYKYLLTIASIVAVVMIIIAGAQWVTSGGNSEAISSAKKRIGGAVIGLFIAYMSYFVLNTINPALVNLRLPQVWLIKPVALVPEFCADLPGATTTLKFAKVAGPDEPDKPLPPPDQLVYTQWNAQGCGSRFLAENGGKTTCVGNGCEDDVKTCLNKEGDRKSYDCADIRAFGDISRSAAAGTCGLGLGGVIAKGVGAVVGGVVDNWGCPPIVNEWLVGVCTESGDGIRFGDGGHGESKGHYWIEYPISGDKSIDGVVANCKQYHGDFKGFVVDFQMHKEWTAVDVGSALLDVDKILLDPSSIFDIGEGTDDRTHIVGKGGVDLGEAGALKGNINKIKEEFLFSVDEIKKGARLNIDASKIEDSHGVTDKNKTFWEEGY